MGVQAPALRARRARAGAGAKCGVRAAHAGHVRVALGSSQNAQHQRAQHIARPRGVGAAVVQRAVLHPAVNRAGGGQKLGEEHDLSMRRGLRCGVPAHMHAATQCVNHQHVLDGLRQRGLLRLVGFTLGVSVPNRLKSSPALKKTAKTQVQLRFLG